MQARFREAILAAAVERRPCALAYVELHNFKAFNVLVGHAGGDAHLQRVLSALQEVGHALRVAGDGFVVLAERATYLAELRACTWQLRAVLGATEAWTFTFADGRRVAPVPWRSFQVICTPRCGAVELGAARETAVGAVVEAALDEALGAAAARCQAMRAEGAAVAAGFAPLGTRPWHDEQRLAEKACPGCGAAEAALVLDEEDLGWARERCTRCAAAYERHDKLWVLGEEHDAAYM